MKTPLPTTIAPWLSVRKSAQAVEFYKTAFGAAEIYHFDGPDDTVVAKLSVDGAEFWVGGESPEHSNFSPETLVGSTAHMILTVTDPDAAFARAIHAGASQICPVTEEHGWRMGRIEDPFGHHWEIGRPV